MSVSANDIMLWMGGTSDAFVCVESPNHGVYRVFLCDECSGERALRTTVRISSPRLQEWNRIPREQGRKVKQEKDDAHQVAPSDHAGADAPPGSLSSAGDSTHMAPTSTTTTVAGDVAGAAAGLRSPEEGDTTGDAGARAAETRTVGVAIAGRTAAGAAGRSGESREAVARGPCRGREAGRGAGNDEVDGGHGVAAGAGAGEQAPVRDVAGGGGGRRWGRRCGGGRRRSWWEEEEVGEGKRAKVRNWQSSIENAVADHRGNRDRYLATPLTSYVPLRCLLRICARLPSVLCL
ncbi:hypothetical protein OH77DRAFT_949512 [Trametes cingulata]|nr:hypothetical protein OH77DRAFT_949512 [Trametes cingulata]